MDDEIAEAKRAAMALVDAKGGDSDAQFCVAIALMDGQDGFRRDEDQGLAWLQRAAALGNADALYCLAILHEAGDGFPQDQVEARRLFTLAAARGSPPASDQSSGSGPRS